MSSKEQVGPQIKATEQNHKSNQNKKWPHSCVINGIKVGPISHDNTTKELTNWEKVLMFGAKHWAV